MGQISGFDVLGKTTSNAYKDAGMTLQEIASERDADALIEADVMCHGDSICFQLRLIRVFPEEETLWSEEYREAKSQIQNLYNRITKQIADEVKMELTPGEEALLAESKAVDPEAFDAYWKGKYHWDRFTPEDMQKALEYFNLAIEKDPDWGPPYAGIAEYWILMRQGTFAPFSVTVPNIYENLNKAIELDPKSANTHYVNALVAVWTGFDWEKGEREFLKALEINPNHAHSRAYYAHLLMILGRNDEALSEGQLALGLDPLNPMIQALYGAVLIDAGEYDQAVSFFEQSLSTAPEHLVAYGTIALAYLFKGDYKNNIKTWIKYLSLENETGPAILETYDEQGFSAAVEALIVELEKISEASFNLDLALMYTIVKSHSKALDIYEKMYEDRDANLPYLSTIFLSYHGPFQIDDPRINELLMKINLPLKED